MQQVMSFQELYPQIGVEVIPAGDVVDIPETNADSFQTVGYLYQIVSYQLASTADVIFG